MLVIADAERPVAIAGVMGGAESEVSSETQHDRARERVLQPALGAAHQQGARPQDRSEHPVRARRRPAAAGHGHGAGLRAARLIGAGTARGTVVDRYPARVEPAVLRLRRAARRRTARRDRSPTPTSGGSSRASGFALREAESGWDVTVPTRRVDVLREVDLIEEVARHYGFDRIPVTFPALTVGPAADRPAHHPGARVAHDHDRRRILRGGDVRVRRRIGGRAVCGRRRGRADRQPAVRELRACCGRRCCRASSARSRTIGAASSVTCGCSRSARASRGAAASDARSPARGRARSAAITGAAAPATVDYFDMQGVVERVCQALRVDVHAASRVREAWLVPGRGAALVADGTRIGLARPAGAVNRRAAWRAGRRRGLRRRTRSRCSRCRGRATTCTSSRCHDIRR